MAITTHGLELEPKCEALKEGEGFIVSIKTGWFSDIRNHELSQEQQQAIQQARQEGLLGLQLEGHEDTFADAINRINTEVNNWVDDINTFIQYFNADNGSTE